ncbi:hypothetical protein [Laceyella putida]|uniref:Group-specific protein n=1 Tax=Laceyella putida TaxID=110101 RepID=A0ABW2RJ41_9BACL
MKTKLIMIEGLPGFGKSTTAQLVHNILGELNIETKLFLEGNVEHPADFEGMAYYTKDGFEQLVSSCDAKLSRMLIDEVTNKGDDYFLPYRKMKKALGSDLPDALFHEMMKNDIYELPLGQHIELITGKWDEFAKKTLVGNEVYVFECCFIQNPVTMGMVKCGAPKEKVINYVMRLAEIIECLNPVLLYINQTDLAFSFKKAIKERPKEWSDGFIDYYTSQGYGKALGFKGLEGTLRVLEARKELEAEIYDMLQMQKRKIDNSEYVIDKYRGELVEILKDYV